MSEEDTRKLEVNRPKLMRCITLEDGLLLAELRARQTITVQQNQEIEAVSFTMMSTNADE